MLLGTDPNATWKPEFLISQAQPQTACQAALPPPPIQLWNRFCAPGSSEPWLLLRYERLLHVLLGTGDFSLSQLLLSYDQFFLFFFLIKKGKTLLLKHNPFVFTFWTPYLEKDHFFSFALASRSTGPNGTLISSEHEDRTAQMSYNSRAPCLSTFFFQLCFYFSLLPTLAMDLHSLIAYNNISYVLVLNKIKYFLRIFVWMNESISLGMCCIKMCFLCTEELFSKTAESLPTGYGWSGGQTPWLRVPSKWIRGHLTDRLCNVNSLCRPETRILFHEFLLTLKKNKKHQTFLYLFKECVWKCRFHGTGLDP